MVEDVDLEVLADEALAGPAEVAEQLGSTSDDEAAEELARCVDAQGIAVPGARAGFLSDLLDRLRGRREVEDLGLHDVDVEWFGFHVPPGGTGGLTFENTTSGDAGVQLKFMGLGWGSGRSVSLTAERDFGVREQCFFLGARLVVRLRRFVEGGGDGADQLQVDVVEMTGSSLRTEPDCPLCFTATERKPPRATPIGRSWDLRSDALGLTERMSLTFGEASEFEVTLKIPAVDLGGLTPGIAMKRSLTSECTAAYTFPGGAVFTAYELVGRRKDFPFWSRL